MPKIRTLVRSFAATFAGLGLTSIAAACAVDRLAPQAAYGSGILLAIAYQFALALAWIDGRPIQMRSGEHLTKSQNPGAYGLVMVGMSLFGWGFILVLGSLLLAG